MHVRPVAGTYTRGAEQRSVADHRWAQVRQQQAGMLTIRGLRLLEERTGNGDSLHCLVRGLRADALKSWAFHGRPGLGGDEHGYVAWVAVTAHLSEVVPTRDALDCRLRRGKTASTSLQRRRKRNRTRNFGLN